MNIAQSKAVYQGTNGNSLVQQIGVIIGLSLLVQNETSAQELLWDASVAVPTANALHEIDGLKMHVIKMHEPEADRFDWLHGIALAWHGDRLFASYGHNDGQENTSSEVANYSVSTDNGTTWSKPMLIDDGDEPNLAVSHGVFHEHDGELWAFHGAFTGHMQDVHTRAYSFDDETRRWEKCGVVVKDALLADAATTANGRWQLDHRRTAGDRWHR